MFARDPVSIKAILPRGDAVLLLRKADQSWELPGGRLDHDESIGACVEREVREETGLSCVPESLVSLTNLRRRGLRSVVVATVACAPISGDGLRLSEEHDAGAFVSVDDIRGMDLLPCYLDAVASWRSSGGTPLQE